LNMELRNIVPETMKYFCTSETTAYYLQKYIQFRKRKIFFSDNSFEELVELIRKKHKGERYVLPCSDAPNEEYSKPLATAGIRYSLAPMYKAVFADLKDLDLAIYDMVVLFSPAGVTSLFSNFPEFKQNSTLFAAFGEQTAKEARKTGLNLHIYAPLPHLPSMAMAMDHFLCESLKNCDSLYSIPPVLEVSIEKPVKTKQAKLKVKHQPKAVMK